MQPQKSLSPKLLEIFRAISDSAHQIHQPVFVIGGFVRDAILGRLDESGETDLDFVTVGSGIKLAKVVAEKLGTNQIAVFRNFGTAQVRFGEHDLEFVGARKESYDRGSRKPVVENGSLKDDQDRRDFTINAMSWSLNTENFLELIDPFDGMGDIKRKLIKTPLEPEKTFDDDPLRMLRAIRFATQLDFNIDGTTLEAIRNMAQRIEIISKERIITEINKIVMAPEPSNGFALLFNTGLLHLFFPEMAALQGVKDVDGVRHKDNFWHTLQVLDNVAKTSDNLWLRWAAIMHDIAKPATQRFSPQHGWTFHGHDAIGANMTKSIFARLGLPLDHRMKYVRKLVRLHLRPIALANEVVTDSAIRRLAFEAGDDFEDLMLLCRADITSKNDKKVQRYLRNFDMVEEKVHEVNEKDRLRNFQPPVTGIEIMEAFKLKPGPVVGKIKDRIQNAILEGQIPNDKDAALEFMFKIKDDYL